MANKRQLKKQISYAIGDIVMESMVARITLPNVDADKIDEVVTKALVAQDEYIRRVSAVGGKDAKLVKKYYNTLCTDFNKVLCDLVKEMNAAIPAKGK